MARTKNKWRYVWTPRCSWIVCKFHHIPGDPRSHCLNKYKISPFDLAWCSIRISKSLSSATSTVSPLFYRLFTICAIKQSAFLLAVIQVTWRSLRYSVSAFLFKGSKSNPSKTWMAFGKYCTMFLKKIVNYISSLKSRFFLISSYSMFEYKILQNKKHCFLFNTRY